MQKWSRVEDLFSSPLKSTGLIIFPLNGHQLWQAPLNPYVPWAKHGISHHHDCDPCCRETATFFYENIYPMFFSGRVQTLDPMLSHWSLTISPWYGPGHPMISWCRGWFPSNSSNSGEVRAGSLDKLPIFYWWEKKTRKIPWIFQVPLYPTIPFQKKICRCLIPLPTCQIKTAKKMVLG